MTSKERYDRLISPEVQQWLSENEKADINKVLLNPSNIISDVLTDVVDQLKAKVKARKKLPRWFETSGVLWPPPISIEQASSEITANFKASLIGGKKLIDLTGGTGIDLLSMASQFERVEYVEQDEWLCKVFSHNSRIFSDAEIVVSNTQAENVLTQIEKDQWVYIDPARRDQLQKKVFKLEDCSPNLAAILPRMLKKGANIMMKLSPLLDISELTNELKPETIYVIAVNNEVKELLAVRTTASSSNPSIQTVDLSDNHVTSFNFQYSEEKNAETNTAPPEEFLYEPNAAIMKSGAFKLIGKAYGLHKLHQNTHLYTSNKLLEDFPGRVFKTLHSVTSKELKRAYTGSDLHVISRNHPLNATEITKKFQLKETGNKYLLAFTDHIDKKRWVLTERLRTDQSAS